MDVFATNSHLQHASRLPTVTRQASVSATEIAWLLFCGALSATAVGLIHIQLRVPGHAILRAVLPMALGLALVPRRSGGLVMAAGAALTAAAMAAVRIGTFPPAALLSVLALGPVLDAALLGQPQGRSLYVRFAAAGATANLLAYIVKHSTIKLGWATMGNQKFLSFGPMALVSFIVCGALAGLVSAAICFRFRPTTRP